jgi:hypothetical protein
MTVRAFDGSSYVTCSLGACGFDAGPSTLLGLVKRSNANAGTVIAASSPDAATKAWALLFGDDATLSGNPRLAVANSILDIASQPSSTTDGWMLQAVTKAAGSANPRFHRCRFSDSTIVHNNAFDPIFDGPVPTSGDTIRFGLWQTGGTGLTGRLAMCAAFDFELSDAQFNALAAARTMSSVLALGPRGLWQFNQSSAGIPVGDMTGNGANEIGRLGTSAVTGDDPPSFVFDIPVAPPNTVAPVVTGTAIAGQTLACSSGTWEGATSFAYQWQRFTGSGYASIGGATSSTFMLTELRLGDLVRCQVTATNTAGSTAVVSNEVGPVIAASSVLVRAQGDWVPAPVRVRSGGVWV